MNKESGNPSQTSSANQAPKPKTKSPRAESEITGFRASACHRALNRTFLTAAKWFCQLGLIREVFTFVDASHLIFRLSTWSDRDKDKDRKQPVNKGRVRLKLSKQVDLEQNNQSNHPKLVQIPKTRLKVVG